MRHPTLKANLVPHR